MLGRGQPRLIRRDSRQANTYNAAGKATDLYVYYLKHDSHFMNTKITTPRKIILSAYEVVPTDTSNFDIAICNVCSVKVSYPTGAVMDTWCTVIVGSLEHHTMTNTILSE